MSNLREKIIKLAASDASLRPHLLKVLASDDEDAIRTFKQGETYREVEVLTFSGDRFRSYASEDEFKKLREDYDQDKILWDYQVKAVEKSFKEGIRRSPVKFIGEEISGLIDVVVAMMPIYISDDDPAFIKALEDGIDDMKVSVKKLLAPRDLSDLVKEKSYWNVDMVNYGGAFKMGGEFAYLDKKLAKILKERSHLAQSVSGVGALRANGIYVR